MPYRSVIVRPLFDKNRALPRMSWAPENLYNLWQRVSPDGPLRSETNFTRTSMTLYQQRWRAKRLSRGYHGDHIAEQKFERWYLPDTLPSIHSNTNSSSSSPSSSSTSTLSKSREIGRLVAGRAREGGRVESERTKAIKEKQSRTPIGTLLFREVERRLDVLMFRACFASSVWQARQMVVHKKVKINGEVVNNPNVRLNPGDLFSVDAAAMPMLSKQVADQAKPNKSSKKAETEIEEKPAETSTATASTDATAESETKTSTTSTDPTTDEPSSSSSSSSKTTEKAYFTLPAYAAPHLFVPAYLEPNFKTCSAVYVRHPTARPGYSEIPSPYDADGEIMSLAWEWFKKKAPNMNKRRHRWLSPERTLDRK